MSYPKECVLKDCEEVVIRPLEDGDETLLTDFFETIHENDRWCMRYDTTKPSTIKRWFDNLGSDSVFSIVTLCNDVIVGHGSLHTREFGATKHVGRFRIIVLPEFRNKRLGTWILLDLVRTAMDKGLEALRADLIAGMEDAAIEALRKFDFFKRAELKDYAVDPQGERHDMYIMVKRLHKGWSDF
ncbi:MAG: GNAT family N-acetyltransferase [Deltaproteobacteria bacterium]|nr:GNAT family N-acetyltransferase [Deltaproteobacteria bacterium]MBW2297422.1 GNAT family N-acetyltransferase [Deltaproteobacteria bacterium]MBW2611349.1 GNAT family N-acetyltransferase [Deltaproteobacteria bacterium]MBW2633572.1 GNAT family N-acetyltransferase [Deltaproteobacteria bacterium]MBW2676496.1 GNAT family N-acetyltransferase [Deltaproteobacteria bacterium]